MHHRTPRPLVLLATLWLWLAPTLAQANSIDSLSTLLASATSDTAKHTLLRKLAIAYTNSNYSRALDYYKQSLTTVENSPHKYRIAESFYGIGRIYYLQGDIDLALNNFTNALRIWEHLDATKEIANTANMLGLTYERKGKYDIATHYFMRALDLHEQRNDINGIAMVTNNLGQVQYYMGNYTKAIEHFSHFYNVNKELNNVSNMAGATNNIASAYMELKEFDKAIDNYLIALNIYDSIGHSLGKGVIMDNLGLLYAKIARYDEALQHHRNALAIFEASKSNYRLATVKTNIAAIYIKQGNIKAGIDEYNQALEIMQPLGITDNVRDINLYLALAHEKLHDYKTAYTYLKEYKTLNDSILDVTTLQNIERIKADYEAEKRNRIEADTNRMLHLNRLLTICISISLLVLLFMLIAMHSNNKRHRLQIKQLSEQHQGLLQASSGMLRTAVAQLTAPPCPFSRMWCIVPPADAIPPSLHLRCQAIAQSPKTLLAYILHQYSTAATPALIDAAIHQFIDNLPTDDTLECLDQRLQQHLASSPLTRLLSTSDYEVRTIAIRHNTICCYSDDLLSLYANNKMSIPLANQWTTMPINSMLYLHASPITSNDHKTDFMKLFGTLAQYDFEQQRDIALNSLKIIDLHNTAIICALRIDEATKNA